jgi:cytochrome c-type biogenesis protein
MKFPLKSAVIGVILFFMLLIAAVTIQQSMIVDSVSFAKTAFIILLGLMVVAGILDGFNPCAFTTLLLWSGFFLNRFGAEVDRSVSLGLMRRRMFGYALLYSIGIVTVYFLFGAGLLQLSQWIQPQDIRLFSKLFGLIVTILGIVMLRDSLLSPSQWIIKMPRFLHPLYKKYSEPTTKLAALASGVVIGLCSIPCSGAIYMAVLVILQPEPWIERTTALFFYNLGFVTPVLLFAAILVNKKLLQAVSKDFLLSRKTLKRIIAIATILMGLLAIYLT